MDKSKTDWTETHAALHAYFSTKPQRDVMLNSIESDEDFNAYTAAENKACLVAQKAFYQATFEINSMEKCQMVDAWELSRATGYDLTVHSLKNEAKPKPAEPFDTRRIEGWSS